MLSFFIFFDYSFMNWYDGKYPYKKGDDQQCAGQGTHGDGPFFPTGEISFIIGRYFLHGHQGMQHGGSNDQVTFEPCADYHHDARNEHRQWLSAFFGEGVLVRVDESDFAAYTEFLNATGINFGQLGN